MARKKVADNTVFVRFVPPTPSLRRHHLEDVFSEIGPIKKSSVIHNAAKNDSNAASSYGFVKYTTDTDAKHAASLLNGRKIKIGDGESVKVKVELAANVDASNKEIHIKKRNRLILRNVSFYADEKHIQKVLEERFGPLNDIHIPRVQAKQSRGFAFVCFEDAKDAKACLQAKDPIVIMKRSVEVAYSHHKTAYESQKAQSKVGPSSLAAAEKSIKEGGEHQTEPEGNMSDSDASSSSDEDASDDDSKNHGKNDGDDGSDDGVSSKRTVFVRNLPFDVTQQDVFDTFVKYGYITGVFLVRDKETQLFKGTAFVTYKKPAAAQRALDDARTSDAFVSQKDVNATGSVGGLQLQGRRLLLDLAVDKETASTLTEKQADKKTGKDRRNIYLKMEGRVDNIDGEGAWNELPESEKLKRQSAWSDKTSKLRSPLFFINPTRLIIRNLSKEVNETQLKRLCVKATQAGLERGVVTMDDQVAHWRSTGDMTVRAMLDKLQSSEKDSAIPSFDEKNIRRYMPSVFIDRDFSSNRKNDAAPSRGFAFVEFTHHEHALACLRELNNNTKYTAEYVQGGRHAMSLKRTRKREKKGAKATGFIGEDGRVLLPRLIVEFTCENKVKAKKQSEHRTAQQANTIKQKIEHKESKDERPAEQRKSRGQRQREKRRREKTRENPTESNSAPEESFALSQPQSRAEPPEDPFESRATKKIKPPKKKLKSDNVEAKFAQLVESYKARFAGAPRGDKAEQRHTNEAKKSGKRWFD